MHVLDGTPSSKKKSMWSPLEVAWLALGSLFFALFHRIPLEYGPGGLGRARLPHPFLQEPEPLAQDASCRPPPGTFGPREIRGLLGFPPSVPDPHLRTGAHAFLFIPLRGSLPRPKNAFQRKLVGVSFGFRRRGVPDGENTEFRNDRIHRGIAAVSTPFDPSRLRYRNMGDLLPDRPS